MPNTFLISDMHFGHVGATQFMNDDGTKMRPWDNVHDMDEAMVSNWNSVVSNKDKVYVLGDVAINRKALPTLGRLNGTKVLIKGNHDIFQLKEYTPYFKDIRACHKLDNFFLAHIPIHPESLARWCSGQIHGHLHSNRVTATWLDPKIKIIDKRYHSVCVEQIDYTPISFEDLKVKIAEERQYVNFV